MMRVDTHQHLWDLKQFPYSWTDDIPPLRRNFLIGDYIAAAEGSGIGKTVFVECDVDEPYALEEAWHVQNLAQQHPLIAGIVAAARPEKPDFPAQLDALRDIPLLRGIRRVLHVIPDGVSQSALFVENVRRLASHRLTFDLCVLARQLPLAVALARECPEVQFILDHCGVPDVKARAFEPWKSDLALIAELPNVACKISGLVAYAGPGWTVEDLRPWVEHTVACFGWKRLMWGGDWPVCTLGGTLGEWIAASDELFSATSEADRDSLFRTNAERIYHI